MTRLSLSGGFVHGDFLPSVTSYFALYQKFVYPSWERNNSLFLERNDRKNQTVARRIVKISFGCETV